MWEILVAKTIAFNLLAMGEKNLIRSFNPKNYFEKLLISSEKAFKRLKIV